LAQLVKLAVFIAILGWIVAAAQTVPSIPPRFEDFPVSTIYRGHVRAPDFGNRFQGTDLRCFGGEPAAWAKEDVNFGGHFVIGVCTCGTGCHYLYMWDAMTGKFWGRLPPGLIDIGPYGLGRKDSVEYQGEEHHADSSLQIVEGVLKIRATAPPGTTGGQELRACGPAPAFRILKVPKSPVYS
jgi:hypothetical protein